MIRFGNVDVAFMRRRPQTTPFSGAQGRRKWVVAAVLIANVLAFLPSSRAFGGQHWATTWERCAALHSRSPRAHYTRACRPRPRRPRLLAEQAVQAPAGTLWRRHGLVDVYTAAVHSRAS